MMPEDQELISQIKQGDNLAFKHLFQKYYSGLFNFGVSLLKREEETREIIQDVFLAIWEKKEKLEIRSVKSYLFSSLNNKALNLIRHEKITLAYENEINQSRDSEKHSHPEINPFVREAIRKAIDQLPERAQMCFILTQVDGMSIKEAAKEIGVAEKTVENQLARSRKTLQKQLKKYR